MLISHLDRDRDEHLALWVLDHAQAFVPGPAHWTVEFLLHAPDETLDV